MTELLPRDAANWDRQVHAVVRILYTAKGEIGARQQIPADQRAMLYTRLREWLPTIVAQIDEGHVIMNERRRLAPPAGET